MGKLVHGVRRPRREWTAAWLTGAAGIYLTDFSVSHFWEKYNHLTLLNWPRSRQKGQQFQRDRCAAVSRPEKAATIFAHFVGQNGPEIVPGALPLTKPPLTHNPPGNAPLASPAPDDWGAVAANGSGLPAGHTRLRGRPANDVLPFPIRFNRKDER